MAARKAAVLILKGIYVSQSIVGFEPSTASLPQLANFTPIAFKCVTNGQTSAMIDVSLFNGLFSVLERDQCGRACPEKPLPSVEVRPMAFERSGWKRLTGTSALPMKTRGRGFLSSHFPRSFE